MTDAPAKLPCGHDVIWQRPEGCLRCRAFSEGMKVQNGLSSLEALSLVKKHGLRVTFGEEVIIERRGPQTYGTSGNFDWLEVSRASTFLQAVIEVQTRLGLT